VLDTFPFFRADGSRDIYMFEIDRLVLGTILLEASM